jgi:hypothetical protein
MADPALRLDANVPGDLLRRSTCIDCDACRIFAPAMFSAELDQSFVFSSTPRDKDPKPIRWTSSTPAYRDTTDSADTVH